MVWKQTEASCPRPARGTAWGRAEAGNRRQGEDADEPQAEFGVFSWLGTQTVHTPLSSALQKGNLMEGLHEHRKVRKARASILARSTKELNE